MGPSTSREEILDAARARFARSGYEGTTVRDVAAGAGVDPALVHYFFGSKQALFAAAMALPVNPGEVVTGVLAGGVDDLGERLAGTFLSIWDDPEAGAPLAALLRSAASHDPTAAAVQEFVKREIVGRLAAALPPPQPELRAALAASQLVGVAMARYILRVEPLASAPPAEIGAWLGPTLQRYFTGSL